MKRLVRTRPKRQLTLFALLAAAAAASAWDREVRPSDPASVLAAAAVHAPRRREVPPLVSILALPERPATPAARGDLFEPRSWLPPAPPKRVAPPPKPTAPVLPFTYLGRMQEGGVTKVFLKKGDDLLVARQDQEIDGSYRIEAIDGERIAFLYLPLNARQDLLIGRPQ